MNYIARFGLAAILALCIVGLPHAASAQGGNIQMLPPTGNCASTSNILSWNGVAGGAAIECGQSLNSGSANLSVGGNLAVNGSTITGSQISALTSLLANIDSLNCSSGTVTVNNGAFSCGSGGVVVVGGGGGGGGGGTGPTPTLSLNGCYGANCTWNGADVDWVLQTPYADCAITGSTSTGIVGGVAASYNNWFTGVNPRSGLGPGTAIFTSTGSGFTLTATYSPPRPLYAGDYLTASVSVSCNSEDKTFVPTLSWTFAAPAPVLSLIDSSGSCSGTAGGNTETSLPPAGCAWDGGNYTWSLSNMNGCTVVSSLSTAVAQGNSVSGSNWFVSPTSDGQGNLSVSGSGPGYLYAGDYGTASVTTNCGGVKQTASTSWLPSNPRCPSGSGTGVALYWATIPDLNCNAVCAGNGSATPISTPTGWISNGCDACAPGWGACPG